MVFVEWGKSRDEIWLTWQYMDTSIMHVEFGLQVEMAGSSIFEYIHSNDHKELAEQLGLNAPKSSSFPSPRSGTSDEGSSTPNPPRSSTPTLSERGTCSWHWCVWKQAAFKFIETDLWSV